MDAITLDQLRTFIAVADEGSFSAAGRKLRRVQSAVSHAMANLEAQLRVQIWDRSTKVPSLTAEGKLLLASARRICAEVDALRSVAGGIAGGLEPSVSLAVDAIVPIRAVVDLCRGFAQKFPSVELRLHTETLSAVSALVLDGTCQLGVIGPAAHAVGLERAYLASVQLIAVVAPEHPLAAHRGPVPQRALADHVNIVLSERGNDRMTPDQGVASPHSWRVCDLGTKHALLLAGLGWGNMPEHMVREDIAGGRLVRIRPAAWSEDEWNLSLSIVRRPEVSLGPAGRWIVETLPGLCLLATAPAADSPSPAPPARSDTRSPPAPRRSARRRPPDRNGRGRTG